MYPQDTIAAISTPLGEGGIGIVRLSGDKAIEIASRAFESPKEAKLSRQKTWTTNYGFVVWPKTTRRIDEALFTVMRAPATYTREDVVEINCHSGIRALCETLEAVLEAGARLAEPGEFTKRAFLNGRIDLAQAEAVIDIVKSKTEAGLGVALNQLEGGLSADLKQIKKDLLEMAAHLETAVDFSDEDVETLPRRQLMVKTKHSLKMVKELLETSASGKIFREGIRTAIIGKPNVGKSSLLNALLREQRAIVTAVPGTTRDVIEETIDVEGISLRLQDTAGIRHPKNEVEKIGVELSKKSFREADLVIFVVDRNRPLDKEDLAIAKELKGRKTLLVFNKGDLPPKMETKKAAKKLETTSAVEVSAIKGKGLSKLRKEVARLVFAGHVYSLGETLVTNVRHQRLLEETRRSLEEVLEALKKGLPEEVISTVLKEGLDNINSILGETASGELLDEIFSQFCIGK